MELEIDKLLRAAWIAGIFPILLASLPITRIASFHRILSGFSNRGKTMQSAYKKFTVPQRFFLHFYVVAVVWTTLLLLMTWVYACKMVPLGNEPLHYSMIASHLTGGSHIFSMHKSHSTPLERRYTVWRTVLLLLLMEVQVWRRLFETVYVFSYSPSARMHIFGYFTGLFSCAPEVVNFAAHCVAEFIVKGREKMPIFEFDWFGYVNPLTKLGWLQWIGAAICIWGWIHQHSCHVILGSLREHKEQTDGYVIPHGDWFEIVSCPHYLAEIVIYAGLLVASGGSDPTIWLLFGFVVAPLP
ncbi:hypothetical protein IFM89_030269 [Coptis chinensis]|uniref:3-oxo-5-alpha-steroid 4-dehydrogenase C-terminal domain-containing protein n=1 Tax=Coptis chinensis TaxID=261450 RepID=A0A835IT69_9MAGN|nr:hypothetical protein IFM89_030269 [Coptis chinensis]